MGHLQEVAKAVAFRASHNSKYITGIELLISGGIAQI
jgi:NAD(P)-dependent dehydrogenase (short-subunit alcohol dehydrogenase family)